MAPEQRERPTEVDHRADIYSLGVVIYELLTGELPIGRFQPPSSKSNVNAQLDEVVMRALEKEPDRRYQQASDFKTGFQAVDDFSPLHSPVPPVKHPHEPAMFANHVGGISHPTGTRCMISFMSGREKKGNWIPGDPQLAITIMAGTSIDLTDVQATNVNLTLLTLMGGVDVIVPHGATVDLDGFILMGATTDNVSRHPNRSSRMNVRIKSWGMMGACDVRTPTAAETRARQAFEKQQGKSPEFEFTFRNAIMMFYKMIAMLVTLAIPIIFIANEFDCFPSQDDGKTIGIVTAIFAGFLWSWADYLRILIGAGPDGEDASSWQDYYSATKLGTVIRSVGLLLGFACPIMFVIASKSHHEDQLRLTGIVCGVLCLAFYIGADKFEETFYGKVKS